jgi:CheY-like chemotaxis protein
VASNGEEGLKLAQERTVNLILLDLVMPIMDGFSFLEARQKLPMLLEVPVLVFSTLSQDTDIKKAKSLGANDYVNNLSDLWE